MIRAAAIALFASSLLATTAATAQGYSVEEPDSTDHHATTPAAASHGSATVTATRSASDGGTVSRERIANTRQPWEYGGVVPGNGVTPPGLSRHHLRNAHGRTVVAWPGFQITPNGSRVFLAVTSQVALAPQPARAPGRVVYRVLNSIVPVRNNRRALETEAFSTPLRRAYLRPHGRDVDLVLEMRGHGSISV
jgi:hypothetical protein